MLHDLGQLLGARLQARDRMIGRLDDLLFDDRDWQIRYFVADVGRWYLARRTLVGPRVVGKPIRGRLPIDLDAASILRAPSLLSARPVSLQKVATIHDYYGWPLYAESADLPVEGGVELPADPHLRSARALRGSWVRATDGPVGRVVSLLIDDLEWAIGWLVVRLPALGSRANKLAHPWTGTRTRPGLRPRRLLIAPRWVRSLSWVARSVRLTLPREALLAEGARAPG